MVSAPHGKTAMKTDRSMEIKEPVLVLFVISRHSILTEDLFVIFQIPIQIIITTAKTPTAPSYVTIDPMSWKNLQDESTTRFAMTP